MKPAMTTGDGDDGRRKNEEEGDGTTPSAPLTATADSPSPREILRSDCGACDRCVSLLLGPDEGGSGGDERQSSDGDAPAAAGGATDDGRPLARRCRICLGVLSCPTLWDETVSSLLDALRPYGTLREEDEDGGGGGEDADADEHKHEHCDESGLLPPCLFAGDAPTVSIPSAIMLRAHAASCHLDLKLAQKTANGGGGCDGNPPRRRWRCCPAPTFHGRVKADVKSRIMAELSSRSRIGTRRRGGGPDAVRSAAGCKTAAPPQLEGDDGRMSVHVLYLHDGAFPEALPCVDPKYKRNRRSRRKRFRGSDPTPMQGGDARSNLEANARMRLQRKRREGDGMSADEHDEDDYYPSAGVVEGAISSPAGTKHSTGMALAEWLTAAAAAAASTTTSSPPSCSVHAAAWRVPFYVGGRYTKSRRDVAQTPFYVRDDGGGGGGGMVRRGITSVEEQICPALSEACGGISVSNNALTEDDGGGGGKAVLYGMCKFHASGREDVDVRMIARAGGPLGGRPFVCEVVDALRMPTREGLDGAVRSINKMDEGDDDIWVDGFYGRNAEGGVGVDSLTFTTSSRYRGLQAETEHKVKHYGCTCWSEAPLPETKEGLDLLLTRDAPTPIVQSTPIRVLHRRSYAERDRTVLRMRAVRTDEHWFHLSLSTTAGTYVKEFVHGDLGRTRPSVVSMLGCKADITELDCEGIEVADYKEGKVDGAEGGNDCTMQSPGDDV